MRRRLTGAILVVVACTLLLLGVPLAVAVQRSYEDSANVVLQRHAAEALAEITLPLDKADLARADTEGDTNPGFSVYDATGAKLSGNGPVQSDLAVLRALEGNASSTQNSAELVVAIPITNHSPDAIVGAVRVQQDASVVQGRVNRAWLTMAGAGLVLLIIAWLIALAQARRFTRPIERLAGQALQIGDGGIIVEYESSGLAEVDAVGTALSASSIRVADLLSRERAFSADVSHQLRTPLTGLRLRLEAAAARPDPARAILDALAEIDRLDATVEHLLALSRDALPVGGSIDVPTVLRDANTRWGSAHKVQSRQLIVQQADSVGSIRASRSAIDQVLDVLISNSLEHGAGTTTVSARIVSGGLAIDVSDAGPGIDASEAEAIFRRRHGSGNGIGLSLARALTEADGGRLLLAQQRPPRFSILFSTKS